MSRDDIKGWGVLGGGGGGGVDGGGFKFRGLGGRGGGRGEWDVSGICFSSFFSFFFLQVKSPDSKHTHTCS